MTTTPTSPTEPVGLREQLLRLLPDEIVFGTRVLSPGQTNLELVAASFANFALKAPTQADLDAEARRRTAANKDPQADPSPGNFTVAKPGDKGRAMAAKRFGTITTPKPGGKGAAEARKRFGAK
jgi:hypothetical protein